MQVRWAAVALIAAAGCGGDEGSDIGGLPEAPACAIDAPAISAPVVMGTRLVDGDGRTITLRGVNAGGRSKYAPYAPFAFADPVAYSAALDAYLDRAATWGIDVLRVPFSWQAAEPAPGQWDEAFLQRLDALIDGAWQRGMWTILDFHQDVYAEPFCGDGFPSWTLVSPGPPRHDCQQWHTQYDTAEVQAAFDAFWSDGGGVRTAYRAMWQRMVERYRDHPGVIGYEPINEPHPGSASARAWAATTLTDFYTEMAALIATADPGALVLLDTTALDGVNSQTSLRRPVGDHLVLAPHSYDPLALFGGEVSADVAGRLAPWAELAGSWNMPALIGEMGITTAHPDAAVHLRRHLDAMDQLGLHGTWWEYSQSPDIWNHEELSLVDAAGAESSMVAELARPYLRAVAGTAAVIAFDPDTGRTSLRYTPSGTAPTEVVIPSRMGPVRIGARGACVDAEAGRLLVRASGGGDVELVVEPDASPR